MRPSILREYFLYKLQYKGDQLALNEFHEFCDHVKNYNLDYTDILIYRKTYAICRQEKGSISSQYKQFYEMLKEESEQKNEKIKFK